MRTATPFTEEDLTALVWLADGWGFAEWTDGFAIGVVHAEDDNYEAGRRMAGRSAAIIDARDKTQHKLLELVEEGKMPEETAGAVSEALNAWADHRNTVARTTRASLVYGTDELGAEQLRQEDVDQELRLVWVEPLIALADAAKAAHQG